MLQVSPKKVVTGGVIAANVVDEDEADVLMRFDAETENEANVVVAHEDDEDDYEDRH